MLGPVFLSSANVEAEIFLNLLVGSLGLAIGLGVIRGGEVRLDAQTLE